MAKETDRETIYRIRHSVYASELAQHPENSEGRLRDSLDAFNVYIIAELDDKIVGFVSVTPPGHSIYSIDKYVSRNALPFSFDHRTYEVRLLTVVRPRRSSKIAALLMYASFRWIEAHGGTRVVAIGRSDLPDLYRKAGFQALGTQIRSGAVTFELLATTISRAREGLRRYHRLLERFSHSVDWQLEVPITRPAP